MAAPDKTDTVYGLLQIAGPNRPGMVAETSAFVLKHGGNIITCHAVRFGRQLFAANVLLSAPADAFTRIEKNIAEIKQHEPRLLRTKGLAAEEKDAVLLYELTVYAYDKEGIVAKVAELMAAEGLDVVQLSAVTYPAPFAGQPLFMIEMLVEAPDPQAATRAHANVEAAAPDLGWDVYWKPVPKSGVKVNPLAAYPPSKMGGEVQMPGK